MTPVTLGAAMTVGDVKRHRDWLFERDRDLELQDFIFPAVLDSPSALIDAAKRMLDGWSGRLGIHGPYFDFDLAPADPDARAFVRKRLGQGIDAAAALGATQMVVHSPFSDWRERNDVLHPGDVDAVLQRAGDTLAPVLERAKEHGVTLVVENIEDWSAERRVQLVDEIASPVLKVSLDTGHAHCARMMSHGRPVDWHVIGAGERLQHVHVQDVDGYADRHWAPGRGSINWIPVFEAVSTHAPDARCVLELMNRDEIPIGFEHLRDLGVVV